MSLCSEITYSMSFFLSLKHCLFPIKRTQHKHFSECGQLFIRGKSIFVVYPLLTHFPMSHFKTCICSLCVGVTMPRDMHGIVRGQPCGVLSFHSVPWMELRLSGLVASDYTQSHLASQFFFLIYFYAHWCEGVRFPGT